MKDAVRAGLARRHRPARPQDTDQLFDLAERCFARWGGYGRTIVTWSALEGVRTWVVEGADGGLAAFIMFAQVQQTPTEPVSAEILALATHPAARGRGIGADLLRAAFAELGRWQGVGAHVWLTVAQNNEAGRRLFERMGFLQQATDSASYPNGVTSLRMARPLAPLDPCVSGPARIRVWAEPTLR